MKKIIKAPPPIHCDRCGCEFSFEEGDIDYIYKVDNHKYIEYAYVTCPVCKRKLEL